MEYNGQKIGQSMAIARFLGRELKLSGKDNWAGAKIEELIDSQTDVLNSKSTTNSTTGHCLT